MISRHPIHHLYKSRVSGNQFDLLSHFFTQILSIADATLEDLIEELEQLRDEEHDDFDQIAAVYEYLYDLTPDLEVEDLDVKYLDVEDLKSSFAESKLIFVQVNGEPGWYQTSECLWVTTANIPGKVSLNDNYDYNENLEDFFLSTVGVAILTADMAYNELLSITPETPIDDVKGLILSFNELLQSEGCDEDPEQLLEIPILPVIHPDGRIRLESQDTEFAIIDRESLASRFKRRIKFLDFTLEEVRRLQPFLDWCDLTSRYLSVAVKEITSVSGSTLHPISSHKRNLKFKAHAILSIASTFNSPRYSTNPEALYQLLRTMRVIETDNIACILSTSQDGKSVEVEEPQGTYHISEEASQLTIYVPLDKRAQEFCFAVPLPANLADWLIRDPETIISGRVNKDAVSALITLLATEFSAIDNILDAFGVSRSSIKNVDESAPEYDQQDVSTEPEIAFSQPSRPSSRIFRSIEVSEEDNTWPRGSPIRFTSNDGLGAVSRQATPRRRLSSTGGFGTAVSRQVTPSRSRMTQASPPSVYSPPLEDERYRAVLDSIVRAAREASFPSRGVWNMTALANALQQEDDADDYEGFDGSSVPITFRSSTQIERDMKVGAAGELYVFELLSRVNPALSGWSRQNWKSTIRKYVTIHPDYADMDEWRGRETADLTYLDTDGNLTDLLIGTGYLPDDWRDARPHYYLEVKTTTGPCHTPFFMSNSQYRRMQAVHDDRDGRENVYIILRVFGLRTGRIGMAVYLDPEQLRLDERLAFTAETWSVVPL